MKNEHLIRICPEAAVWAAHIICYEQIQPFAKQLGLCMSHDVIGFGCESNTNQPFLSLPTVLLPFEQCGQFAENIRIMGQVQRKHSLCCLLSLIVIFRVPRALYVQRLCLAYLGWRLATWYALLFNLVRSGRNRTKVGDRSAHDECIRVGNGGEDGIAHLLCC